MKRIVLFLVTNLAIMLVLGVMLGTLVMAMYWPIFQLGQVL